VHGGVVSSAVLELFGTFSFKRKSTEEKLLLKRQKKVNSKQKYNRIRSASAKVIFKVTTTIFTKLKNNFANRFL
jgi:hypothetical protein